MNELTWTRIIFYAILGQSFEDLKFLGKLDLPDFPSKPFLEYLAQIITVNWPYTCLRPDLAWLSIIHETFVAKLAAILGPLQMSFIKDL